jgi:hypothetical protein
MEINVEQNIKKARRTTYTWFLRWCQIATSLYEELLWCHLLVVRLFGVNSDFVDQKSIVCG